VLWLWLWLRLWLGIALIVGLQGYRGYRLFEYGRSATAPSPPLWTLTISGTIVIVLFAVIMIRAWLGR
jgi:hypothetical protein